MKDAKPLTEREQLFVTHYLSNGYSARAAAKSAGYSDSSCDSHAHHILDKEHIKQRISNAYRKVEARNAKELCMSIEAKAKLLTQIIYDIIPQDGSPPKREYYKDALKAISEMNKMSGDYAPDKRLSVTVDATKDKLIEAKKVYEEY
jgi:transposase